MAILQVTEWVRIQANLKLAVDPIQPPNRTLYPRVRFMVVLLLSSALSGSRYMGRVICFLGWIGFWVRTGDITMTLNYSSRAGYKVNQTNGPPIPHFTGAPQYGKWWCYSTWWCYLYQRDNSSTQFCGNITQVLCQSCGQVQWVLCRLFLPMVFE